MQRCVQMVFLHMNWCCCRGSGACCVYAPLWFFFSFFFCVLELYPHAAVETQLTGRASPLATLCVPFADTKSFSDLVIKSFSSLAGQHRRVVGLKQADGVVLLPTVVLRDPQQYQNQRLTLVLDKGVPRC
jgi:hypothetical protein